MDFEMQVRVDAVRIARVADEADCLAGLDAGTGPEPGGVGGPGNALAPVVVRVAEVIVEMDVLVAGAALAVEVEHAAGTGRGRPELDRARLGGNGDRVPRGEDVVARVTPALRARLAEVVAVRHRPDDGEDEPWHALSRRGRAASGEGRRQCHSKGEKYPSGCRPAVDHRSVVRARRARP